MGEIIVKFIGDEILATAVMSFVPLIELKGGIVFARMVGFDFLLAFALAFLGSSLAFFPIYFLLKPILNLLKKIKWFNNFVCKVEDYFEERAKAALEKQIITGKKHKISAKALAVFIFVAIPLPMTGIWMGTAIAVFLGMKFKEAILPIILGNFVAGTLMSVLAEICLRLFTIKVLNYILYGLFGLALLLTIACLIKVLSKKKGKEEK